ncbi:hypothetical protein [Nocardia sp. NRRL S-836]|nr:hypothetical protein [Nocardia sp. NRRL S-836]
MLLGGCVMAAPDFAVLDSVPVPVVEPFGLLGSLPTLSAMPKAGGITWPR